MVFFKKEKEISDAEFKSEMRKLEIEVARAKKKNELLRIKAELEDENRKNSKFGKFFQVMGDLGRNMNDNLDREYKSRGSGVNFDHKGLTDGLPGLSSKASGKK